MVWVPPKYSGRGVMGAATRAYIPQTEDKIVSDHFHVTRQVTEAVDKVRRKEHKALMVQGDDRLKGPRHLWLAYEEKVPEWRKAEFAAVKGMNLKTAWAWAIKESLRILLGYSFQVRSDYSGS